MATLPVRLAAAAAIWLLVPLAAERPATADARAAIDAPAGGAPEIVSSLAQP